MIKRALSYIFAEKENLSLENRLFLSTIIFGVLICINGSIMSLIISPSLVTIGICIGFGVLLVILYYFIRYKNLIEPFKIPVIITAFFGICTIWIFDGGLNGPDLMVAFVILILGLIGVSDSVKKYIALLFLTLVISIYLVQFYIPEIIVTIPSYTNRWIDSLVTAIYCTIFIFLIISFLHRNYNIEKERAEENEKKLIELNANKDRFMSILAHDLKSPFASILGFLDLLSKNIHQYDREKIEAQLTIINDSAKQHFSLLEDLLIWTGSNSGKLDFEPRNINIRKICSESIENLILNASHKKVSITNLLEDDLNLNVDPGMIKTIFRNLVSNAIKFNNAGGKIEIYSEPGNKEVVFTISDNGIGIEEARLKLLFDFSHSHTTSGTSNETGTGLGLFLCKEFIEKHGGRFWAMSEKGSGSKFKFTIPCNRMDSLEAHFTI